MSKRKKERNCEQIEKVEKRKEKENVWKRKYERMSGGNIDVYLHEKP